MPTTTIVFVLLPHVHLLDLAGADQVFLEAKEQGAEIHLEYCSAASEGELLQSNGSLAFGQLPHFSTASLSAGDYLIIPGADVNYLLSPQCKQKTALFEWIRAMYHKGCNICSVCTGAYVLAQSGLLDGKQCTTHWKHTARLQALYPAVHVQENILFTEDSGVLTSAGVSSGIDLALHILATLKGDMLSFKVARELVLYLRRSGNQKQHSVYLQYRNHVHAGIHTVQDWLIENIHLAPRLDDLAEKACMSTRTLTRLFKKETGISIGEYIRVLRAEVIRELTKNPNMTQQQIAVACGLKSERQLRRLRAASS